MTVRERQASVRARRKKRGRRLIIAYALCGVIFLLLALMIVLMVCGVLYIREHLASAPDRELPDGNMEPDDPALSEPPIVPIETAVPEEPQFLIVLFKIAKKQIHTCEYYFKKLWNQHIGEATALPPREEIIPAACVPAVCPEVADVA